MNVVFVLVMLTVIGICCISLPIGVRVADRLNSFAFGLGWLILTLILCCVVIVFGWWFDTRVGLLS
ncbi:hypothetical protein ACQ3HE_06830 [Plantibacter auratus]|uniref:hypothetical protein n=1 Tax=Plantibacter auratus TaxID=272914 RepID=UPI003D333FF0